LCRFNAIAEAASEEEFDKAVDELHKCAEWQDSESLHSWFTDKWLAEKRVSMYCYDYHNCC